MMGGGPAQGENPPIQRSLPQAWDRLAAVDIELDRSGSAPLYEQVAQHLEAAIQAGTLGPDQQLGNELILANRWGVSRSTMRRAISVLVAKGILVRRQGVRTVVVSSSVASSLRPTRLYDDLLGAGQRPSTVVLKQEVIPAPDEVATVLRLPRAHPVVHLVRVRSSAEEPLALVESFLPPDLADLLGSDLTVIDLYEVLRLAGVSMKVAQQRVGARPGTDEECLLLNEPAGSPVLTVDRATCDDTARVIEFAMHVYRASRYQYPLTLVTRS